MKSHDIEGVSIMPYNREKHVQELTTRLRELLDIIENDERALRVIADRQRANIQIFRSVMSERDAIETAREESA
jgi:hypothetical protein